MLCSSVLTPLHWLFDAGPEVSSCSPPESAAVLFIFNLPLHTLATGAVSWAELEHAPITKEELGVLW
jgi:hypothetical protein